MGFSSRNCRGCGHPLLSIYGIFEGGGNEWMIQATLIEPSSLIRGEFSGYNSVFPGHNRQTADSLPLEEHTISDQANCYHDHCWELEGCPSTWRETEISESARDQGYFFNVNDHNYSQSEISDWFQTRGIRTHAEEVGVNRHSIMDAEIQFYTIESDDEELTLGEALSLTGYASIEEASADGINIQPVKETICWFVNR